jgi:hypothetical protein
MNIFGYCGTETLGAKVSPVGFVDIDNKLTIDLEFTNPLSDSVTL